MKFDNFPFFLLASKKSIFFFGGTRVGAGTGMRPRRGRGAAAAAAAAAAAFRFCQVIFAPGG